MELHGIRDTSKGLTRLCKGISWAVLVGTWETGLITELMESDRRLLLIERNAHMAERRQDYWTNQPTNGLKVTFDPIGAEAGSASWYCFNDPRLDGLLAAHTLQAEFPNLRLLNEEIRTIHTLDNLVGEWIKEQGLIENEGALLLNGRDSLPLLNGAADLLKILCMILWRPNFRDASELTHKEQEEAAGIQSLMSTGYMIPSEEKYEGILVWNHDYRRELIATNSEWHIKFERAIADRNGAEYSQAQIQSRMDELGFQLDKVLLERDALTTKKQQLELEVNGLKESFEQFQKERDILEKTHAGKLEKVVNEQEVIKHERLNLITEKHVLIADRDRIAANGIMLQNELEEIKGRFAIVQIEQDSLGKERDDLSTIINEQADKIESVTQKLNSMETETLKLITENENLLIANSQLTTEKEIQKTQLHALMEERDASIAENTRLRENQAFFVELTEQSEQRMATFKALIEQIEVNPNDTPE